MKKITILILFITVFFSCNGLSKKQLTEEVKEMIIKTYKETPGLEKTEVVDLILEHEDGDKYKGVLTVIVPNLFGNMMNSFNSDSSYKDKNEITYELEVIYDGVDIDWKILD